MHTHTNHWAQKAFAHRNLRHRCIYTEKPLQNTLNHKACTKHFPVLFCPTKLAQSTSQYYFVLQSLHKALPSTILYYKADTKHVPVLLCTSKLAQSTSQYYFVLQTFRKALPSTTLYYKQSAVLSPGAHVVCGEERNALSAGLSPRCCGH